MITDDGTYGRGCHALIRVIVSACCDIFTMMSIKSTRFITNVRLSVPAPVSSLI